MHRTQILMQTEDFDNLQTPDLSAGLSSIFIYIVKSTENIHISQIFPQLTSSLPGEKDLISDHRLKKIYECYGNENVLTKKIFIY